MGRWLHNVMEGTIQRVMIVTSSTAVFGSGPPASGHDPADGTRPLRGGGCQPAVQEIRSSPTASFGPFFIGCDSPVRQTHPRWPVLHDPAVHGYPFAAQTGNILGRTASPPTTFPFLVRRSTF
jgi:hypothetical protein